MGHGRGGGPSVGSWGSSTVQHWEPLPRLLGFAGVAELLRGAHRCPQPPGAGCSGGAPGPVPSSREQPGPPAPRDRGHPEDRCLAEPGKKTASI